MTDSDNVVQFPSSYFRCSGCGETIQALPGARFLCGHCMLPFVEVDSKLRRAWAAATPQEREEFLAEIEEAMR
jgi:predicted amidophosphoribosyltransferase